MTDSSLIAFTGVRKIASGSAREVLPILKERFDRAPNDPTLIFEIDTGRQIEIDLRGALDEILERAAPQQRKPGRPRLGVTSREVSLLPRHWSWLEQQPSGSSAALRRLVEPALKAQPGRERARRIRAALSLVLTALAGNRPKFEEACRALFAGDRQRFEQLIERWPKDIREYALVQSSEAARLDDETTPSPGLTLVRDLFDRVWNAGDYTAIERLVAPRYRIHSDPGDAWEGQTLDHSGYRDRVDYSRRAFPDLAFSVEEGFAAGQRVCIRWRASGTHEGDLVDLRATGKRLEFAGQTIYELDGDHVAGHWQVVDRLGFIQQLR